MNEKSPASRVIAIDGPAGSGKSTVGRETARRLGLRYVDTGAMYRAVAVAAIRHSLDPGDESSLARTVEGITVRPGSPAEPFRVFLGGADVTEAVREPRVDALVPVVARHGEVRDRMVKVQRALAQKAGLVMEGRDIGTVVFPDAALKIYLDASPEVRAARRHAETGEGSRKDVGVSIERRDEQDRSRGRSPLLPAKGALVIDTTDLPFDAVVDRILSAARSAGFTIPDAARE
jgi:cytidylate kinase